MLTKIQPQSLKGPRSYFTDIDPFDPEYEEKDITRKLKLQLLTKNKVVIAASSLFHNIGYELFSSHDGLVEALEQGIIVPAIRDELGNVEGFFSDKANLESYPLRNKDFFEAHTYYAVPWDLASNTSWFQTQFFTALRESSSILRSRGGITGSLAADICVMLEELINREPKGKQYLQRPHIEATANRFDLSVSSFLISYGNLVYRLSGARVVNSEGHFPQSNLTKLGIIENDKVLSDENIFWDMYVEAVVSYLNSAVHLTPDRLDRLTFKDILKIRKSFFDIGFISKYDNLIGWVKSHLVSDKADKLILDMHEINEMAYALRHAFVERVSFEMSSRDTDKSENALFQVANMLAKISNSSISLIVGTLSSLKSIPEITTLISNNLSESMSNRVEWMRNFVNTRIGWTDSQKRSFLKAYKIMVTYGLK